jgi:uncharacterized protein YjbJ (UPF0337 family)
MGERVDELKGRVKEKTGQLTGNEQIEAEGKADAESARAERKTRGALRQAGGRAKEALGALTGDDLTEAEGRAQRVRGEAEQRG